LLKKKAVGLLPAGVTIVVTLTGNGLKDVQWALQGTADPVVVPVDVDAAAAALGLA
jgi:threonine synthase